MADKSSDRPPAQILWSNISTRIKEKVILDNVSGNVLPGQFLVIIGPSGAGKTSLINILADKYPGKGVEQTQGQVLLNGKNVKELPYKFITAFVPQADILIESLTVKETLMFSANLALRLTKAEKEERVNKVIDDLGLTHCQSNTVGGIFKRGVSGGEKKRTSIGFELITDPAVLFLDEPTTGLDAYTALLLVILIKNLAQKQNRTVIATVHQPTSEIYEELDQLSLIVKGRTVYQGGATEALEYFTSLGYPCKSDYNPADHLMNVVCAEDPSYPEPLETRLQTLCARRNEKIDAKSIEFHELKPYPQANILNKYLALTIRGYKNYFRMPLLLKSKLAKLFVYALVIVSSFWQLGTNTRSLQDRQGALYMFCSLVYMDTLFSSLMGFQANKPVFIREYSGRRYNTLTYFFSILSVNIPVDVGVYIIFIAGSYFLVGLNDHFVNFVKFTGSLILLALAGMFLGNFVSIMSPKVEVAMIMIQLFNLPMMTCAGLTVNLNNIPSWFFFKYISPLRYSYEAIYKNEYDNLSGMSQSLRDEAVDRMNFGQTFDEATIYISVIVITLIIFCGLAIQLVNRKF